MYINNKPMVKIFRKLEQEGLVSITEDLENEDLKVIVFQSKKD